MVQYLINKGSNLNHKSVTGMDTLHVACRAGNVKMAYLILSAGAYVDTTDGDGDTPFLWCLKVRTYFPRNCHMYMYVIVYLHAVYTIMICFVLFFILLLVLLFDPFLFHFSYFHHLHYLFVFFKICNGGGYVLKIFHNS